MARTPVHAGEILADGRSELGLGAAELVRLIGVPPNRISRLIAGRHGHHRRHGAPPRPPPRHLP